MTTLPEYPIGRLLDLSDPRGAGAKLAMTLCANRDGVNLLLARAPALVHFEENATLAEAVREALEQDIDALSPDSYRLRVRRVIDYIIRAGNEEGRWVIEPLSATHQSLLASSPFSTRDARRIGQVEDFRRRLAEHIPALLKDGRRATLLGALMVSLAAFDAVLIAKFLSAAIANPIEDCALLDGGWWSFTYAASKRPDVPLSRRRWIVGSISTKFLHVLQAMDFEGELPTEAQCLAAVAEVLGEPLPNSARKLVAYLKPFWAIYLSPVHFRLATVAACTESLPPLAFARLVEGRALPAKLQPASYRADTRAHASSRRACLRADLQTTHPSPQSHLSAFRALRQTLHQYADEKRPTREALLERFASWRNAHSAVGGWTLILAEWAFAAVLDTRRAGKGNLRESSALRYLTAVGKWLVILASDLSPASVSEWELLSRLDTLRVAANALGSRELARNALEEILIFAERFGGPIVDLDDWWGPARENGRPDANLLTPVEFGWLLSFIDQSFAGMEGCHAHRRARVLAILAFRCGCRWGELRTLPTEHIRVLGREGDQEITILLLSTDFGQPKTSNGERALPLSRLVPPAELAEVARFLCEAMTGMHWGGVVADACVFAEPDVPHLPPDSEWTRDLIQKGMRHVSGDTSLVFHHLRHGAATYLDLRTSSEEARQIANTIPGWSVIDDSAFPFRKGGFETYAEWLTGRPGDARPIRYALSDLLGHLDSEISDQHYVHLSEFGLFAATKRVLPNLSAQARAVLTNRKVASIYHEDWTKRRKL